MTTDDDGEELYEKEVLALEEFPDQKIISPERLVALHTLEVGGCQLPADTCLAITRIPNLIALDLTDYEGNVSPIGNHEIEMLSASPSIKGLRLAGTNITDRGLSHLKRFRSLESLDVGDTKITGEGIESLKDCKKLKELTFDEVPVPASVLDVLAEKLPLEFLCIEVKEDRKVMDSISRMKQLRKLFLTSSRVTVDELKKLKGLSQLQELACCIEIDREHMKVLASMESLEDVAIHGGGGKLDLEAVFELRSLPKLRKLDINPYTLSKADYEKLEEAFPGVELILYDYDTFDES